MNARPAGWEPDPSGRHEYRYWDGTSWTDDVADQGVTSVDSIGSATGPGGDPTTVVDVTRQYASPPGGYGQPPGGGYGQPPGGGYGAPPGRQPAYGTGTFPPGRPPKAGPSTGLIVGLAALALAVIVGLVVVLTGGDDNGDTATDDTSTTEDTSGDDTATTEDTSSDDTSSDDTSSDDTTDGGSSDVLVDAMAEALVDTGMFDQEQAECFSEVMLDELGIERLAEIGASGGDMSSLTPEELAALAGAVGDCGLTNVPTDLESET
jgi:hypothetical protein